MMTFRVVTLKDRGKIKEKLTEKGDTSYRHEMVESPLLRGAFRAP